MFGGLTTGLAEVRTHLTVGLPGSRQAQQAQIIAAGFAPNNFESAIAQSLTPGPYTAIVRGVNGTTGLALVEIFAQISLTNFGTLIRSC
ncbi:MAG TPA: hypothetical protein VFQ78_09775 [Candidatus Udaeobacter sp.]|nr:hypothetical protein [Candidatus Udaeobacter sp.]